MTMRATMIGKEPSSPPHSLPPQPRVTSHRLIGYGRGADRQVCTRGRRSSVALRLLRVLSHQASTALESTIPGTCWRPPP